MIKIIPFTSNCSFKYLLIFLIFISFLSLPSIALFSQSYQVRAYIEDDGLASSEVFDITQDFSGRMWFATRTGVSVYDGTDWKTYGSARGLPPGTYQEIECDRKGTIWAFSTFSSIIIARYNEKEDRWELIPKPGQKRVERINAFATAVINNQNVLAVGLKGLGLCLRTGNSWQFFNSRNGLISPFIEGIAAHGDSFYIATDKGLSVLKGNKIDNTINDLLELPTPGITGISVENSSVWLLGEGWIGHFEIGKGRFKLTARDIHLPIDPYPVFLQPDSWGGLFYGNASGIFHISREGGTIHSFGMEQGLVTVGATAAFVDREKNIWFTSLRGVSKISSMRFANYHQAHGLLSDETTAVLEIKPGRMVFGHNDGLTFFNPGDNRYEHIMFPGKKAYGKTHTRVLDMHIDRQGNIYAAASYLGVARIDRNNNLRWYGEKEGLTGDAFSVITGKAGKVWVGTRDGVFLLRDNKFLKVEPKNDNKLLSTRRFFPGPGNSIYVVGVEGVYLLQDNILKPFLQTASIDENNVYALLVDSRDRMWLGTKAGLCVPENNTIVKYEKQGFRIDRPVYFIIEDRENRLWFGTDNGVIKWNGREWQSYTIKHGLIGQETNRAAGFVDHRGRIWIGTDRGLNCYREEFERGVIPPPIVKLISLSVAGQQRSLQVKNKLNHNMNNLTFNYRAVSFIDEDAVRYQTKLEGFDAEWSKESKLNRVRYTNLFPGSYRFFLKACNGEGLWSEVVSSALIIIRKPFWKRWWFYLLILLTIMFSTAGIYKYFVKKRYAIVLEKQVQEKTEELQKAHDELEIRIKERTRELAESNEQIKASLKEKEVLLKEIHHRVKNNLQVIISLLNLQSKYIKDEKSLDVFKSSRERVRAMALVHEKLYRSKDLSRINFREYIRSLVMDLFSAYSLQPGKVQLKVEIADIALDINISIPIGLIVNELVSNSLKHAFPGKRKGEVSITLVNEKNEQEAINYKLIVADNGIGFPGDVNFRDCGTLGMLLVISLVKQLHGDIELDRSTGTTFTIEFKKPAA